MIIATQYSAPLRIPVLTTSTTHPKCHHLVPIEEKTSNSMSQSLHQGGIFSFPNASERSNTSKQQDEQAHHQLQYHMARQSQTNPLREEEVFGHQLPPVFETSGMLSEMFNFPTAGPVENQIPPNYVWPRQPQPQPAAVAHELLGNKLDLMTRLGFLEEEKRGIGRINENAANSMHLSLMNPHLRSTSPPPSSSLHILLPNPPSNSHLHQGFHSPTVQSTSEIGGAWESTSQGLSLSLSSSLQHLEVEKAERLRMGNGGMFFCNEGLGGAANSTSYVSRNLGTNNNPQIHVGCGISQMGMVNILKNSKYSKVAQELLEEFCSVGRGQFKKQRPRRNNINPTTSNFDIAGSSSLKDLSVLLSAADKIEYQRRKIKLLSMLDEVDGRYIHYSEEMQEVIKSFDSVMGIGAASPYTGIVRKAMSQHFRCTKDAIVAQLKHTCELLGEKDVTGASGLTKGETPRLRLLDQSFRHQKSLHQMDMSADAWKPQRGLPDRSVNILRAWLFEHFLHPYPSDADKHLLSRQTGLSRSQVSNWFINARVRLWKPMVEDMYQQEAKEAASASVSASASASQEEERETTNPKDHQNGITPLESNLSHDTINYTHCLSGNSPILQQYDVSIRTTVSQPEHLHQTVAIDDTTFRRRDQYGLDVAGSNMASKLGTPAGDVSLTLGLRHIGNMPELGRVSVRNF